MIITGTYFKGDIYLPHAKTSLSDGVKDVEGKVNSFIDEYEQDCLLKCLGRMYNEFASNLDANEPTFIKSGSDVKWDYLLNGHTYTNPSGDTVTWKGIRQKSKSLGVTELGEYDKSFLANYVYFFYESNSHITRGNAGNAKLKSANAESVSPNNKAVKAWRKFITDVQGDNSKSPFFVKSGIFGGLGADYAMLGNNEVTLYQFINDSNELVADTYENFEPKEWGNINQFGM